MKRRLDARHSPGALPAEMAAAGFERSAFHWQSRSARTCGLSRQQVGHHREFGPEQGSRSLPQHPAAVWIRRETREPAPSAGSQCERRASSQSGDCQDSLVEGGERGELNQVETTAAFVLAALCGKDAGGD